ASNAASFCSSALCCSAVSVPVRSVTRAVSGGIACNPQGGAAASATETKRQANSSGSNPPAQPARGEAGVNASSAAPRRGPGGAEAGAGGGVEGAPGVVVSKLTVGAVEISPSFATVKFGFVWKPKILAVIRVGKVRTVTL